MTEYPPLHGPVVPDADRNNGLYRTESIRGSGETESGTTDQARRPDLTADAGRKGKSNFCCGTVRRCGSLVDDLFGHHSCIIPKAGCSPVPAFERTAFDFVPEILPGARHRAAYRGEEESLQVGKPAFSLLAATPL